MKSKICGISDTQTLKYLTGHPNPPQYIGFIVNYPKSKRFVKNNQLKELLKIDKNKSKYVAVLVQPSKDTLEEIMLERAAWRKEIGNEAVPPSIRNDEDLERILQINPER